MSVANNNNNNNSNNNNGSTASILHDWGPVFSRAEEAATTNATKKSGPTQKAYGFELGVRISFNYINKTTVFGTAGTYVQLTVLAEIY